MGWKPPQRPAWVKAFMKMPGHTRVQLSLLTILATSSVLSTGFQICNRAKNTSVGNTSIQNVSLEVVRDGLRLRAIGKDTTEALMNLKQIEDYLGTNVSKERSSQPTQQKAK